jgi:AraC-like DNA-binding protein
LVFINDREMHFARSTPGTISRWAYLVFDPAALIGSAVDEPQLLSVAELGGPEWQNVLSSRGHPWLARTVRAILRELDEQPPGYRSAVRGLAWTVLVMLHRLPGRAGSSTAGSDRLERIAPALEFIAAHYADDLDVSQLARRCSLSATHFRRRFHQATGESPRQYVINVRLRMAASLLANTDRPVIDIALSVGYPTLSNFSRQFRAAFGCSPRQYRSPQDD